MLLTSLAAALAGCSGGTSGGGADDPLGPSFDPLTLISNDDGEVADGDVVGTIVVTTPDSPDFILSATLPVPRGAILPSPTTEPLSVRLPGGGAAPTQVEVVSRYPNPADGADVVQVLAHVRRPANLAPGAKATFEVGFNRHAQHQHEVPESVTTFLGAPGALKLISHDVFGHQYEADLLNDLRIGGGEQRVLMDGQVKRQVATHEVMLPSTEVGGGQGTLPHLMGVHAYIGTMRGQEFFTVDLHVHNAFDGLDPTTNADDALGEVYFRDLTLRVPSGWEVAVGFENPALGTLSTQGAWSSLPLVSARSDGKLHVMPRMGQMVRRLVVYRPASERRAIEQLHAQWNGFCTDGTTRAGQRHWSWWNPSTARYYNQNRPLPNLEYTDLPAVAQSLENELGAYSDQLRTGAAGPYPFDSPALGWAHPWGTAYGGMTGGDEINILDGHLIASTASSAGLRLTQLRMRSYVDRQPNALYGLDGTPTRVEDLLVQQEDGPPYVDLSFYILPNGGSDPFGFEQAPMFQVNAVHAMGLAAPYANELLGWMPIDYQHLIRYTKELKTLAWLSNDVLAKELLCGISENFRLSYHQFANESNGGVQGSGLRAMLDLVQQHPGIGTPFGRGEAWGLDANLAVYAMSDPDNRARMKPWFDMIATAVVQGASGCTGNIMAKPISGIWGGDYRLRAAMETAFVDNLLMGMATTLYEGLEEERKTALFNALVNNVRATIQPPFWSVADGAPWVAVAVGPIDPAAGDFCFNVPGNLHQPYVQRLEGYSSMAYAYELTQDPIFLFRATEMLGGGDLWNQLQALGTENLKNTGALVSVCQALNQQ